MFYASFVPNVFQQMQGFPRTMNKWVAHASDTGAWIEGARSKDHHPMHERLPLPIILSH